MIQCDETKVRLEETDKTLLNDWLNVTMRIYECVAKDVGLKAASKMFVTGLQIAANDAAHKLMEKGELPDE